MVFNGSSSLWATSVAFETSTAVPRASQEEQTILYTSFMTIVVLEGYLHQGCQAFSKYAYLDTTIEGLMKSSQ